MTSTKICVTPQKVGVFHVDEVHEDAIKVANQYLQVNHDEWHVLWNPTRAGGLHNHQVHYLLTDIALGASAEQIRQAFDNNKGYMRSIDAGDESGQLSVDEINFASGLGHHEYYHAWLAYFTEKIDRSGWQNVLNEYLFARTARADDLLGRMMEGAIHPIIHLGFGIEFDQPAIIAEALAQGAIHPLQAGEFLVRVEKLVKEAPTSTSSPSFVELLAAARSDPAIRDAKCWSGGSFEMNGNFFAVLPKNLDKLAAQYTVEVSEAALKKHSAEACNVAAWFTAAAQRPDKQVKFDFFFMHCVNISIFLSVFVQIPWLSLEDKVRLLEWKVRFDLVVYACQGSPKLRTEEIVKYKAREPDCMTWSKVIDRAMKIPCDGHVVKMIRALNHASIVSKPFESQKENEKSFPVKGDMWLKIANMVLDSTEDYPDVRDKWMRGPGFDTAWDVVPDRG